MNVHEILAEVEKSIQTKDEREYFLIHEARYKHVLENIAALRQAQGQNPQKTKCLRILDVGCYPYHLGAALELMGHEVWGIASSHEPIRNKNVVICNIEKDTFPYKDNFFDLVVCTEVIEHLPQSPSRALREMWRVCKPQGHLLVTTPNITRSINRAKMALGKSVMYPLEQLLEDDGNGSNLYHRHNREYTLPELKTLAHHAGWTIEKSEHFVSYTPFRRRVKPDPLWLASGKIANYILMAFVSGLRDTLFVVGRKI